MLNQATIKLNDFYQLIKEMKVMNKLKKQDEQELKNLTINQVDTGDTPDQQDACHDAEPPAHNHKKHMMHMALCCGVPLLLLLALPIFGYKGFLLSVLPLICPIMMFAMMPMMMRGMGRGSSCHSDSAHRAAKPLERKE